LNTHAVSASKSGKTRSAKGVSRERVLDAAIELFGEQGYAATSVSSICQRAGVTKPTLYWHFESKEGLMAAVLETVVERWIERFETEASVVAAPGERLQRMTENWRQMYDTDPHLLRLPLIAALEQGGSERARSAVLREQGGSERARSAVLRVWDQTAGAIASGIQNAVAVDVPDVDLVGHAVVALMNTAFVRYRMGGDEDLLKRQLAEVERVVTTLVTDHLRRPN
jgi:AcrR family transcriptional regulator